VFLDGTKGSWDNVMWENIQLIHKDCLPATRFLGDCFIRKRLK